MSDYLDLGNEELLDDFFLEADSQLELMEQGILQLEKDPTDKDGVDEVFRAAHTLKGSAGVVQMTEVGQFTHVMENVLDEVRDGKVTLDGSVIDILLTSLDIISDMISARRDGGVYDGDTTETVNALNAFLVPQAGAGAPPPPPAAQEVAPPPPAAPSAVSPPEANVDEILGSLGESEKLYLLSFDLDKENPMLGIASIEVLTTVGGQATIAASNPELSTLKAGGSFDTISMFVTTTLTSEALQRLSSITDVTTNVNVREITSAASVAAVPSSPSSQPQSQSQGQAESGESLSAEEIEDMHKLLHEGQHLFSISLAFDPENPMRGIASIEVLTTLKQHLDLMHTVPDFTSLKTGGDFESVTLHVASLLSADKLKEIATISGVTKDVQVSEIARAGATSGGAPSAPAPASQPAVEPMQNRDAVLNHIGSLNIGKAKSTPPPAAPAAPVAATPAGNPAGNPTGGEAKKEPAKAKKASEKKENSVLRVDSARIDTLMNLVSEGVINKASLNQYGVEQQKSTFELQQRFSNELEVLQNRILGVRKEFKSNQNEIEGDLYEGRDSFEFISHEIEGTFERLLNDFNAIQGKYELFKHVSSSISRNMGELHEAVLRIRMVPIEQLFSRFPRMVRDLSKKLGKNVELVLEGGETELDKAIVEELVDPLMHCIRNSMDHGIESPEVRESKGKEEKGTLTLRAANEGNAIAIYIEDDGAGINRERVLGKAISSGIVSSAANLSDAEVHQLILKPGFSTAEKITDVSGRGVGLDVVKSHIDQLKGSIRILSEEDIGSSFVIKLPLTLAIISGLLVRVEESKFVIPITSVIESVRREETESVDIEGGDSIRLRDEIIRLVNMGEILGFSGEQREGSFITIVKNGDGNKLGLIVDELLGGEDIVIKPLDIIYSDANGIAGATILGDGSVSLIVDINQMFEMVLHEEDEGVSQRGAS